MDLELEATTQVLKLDFGGPTRVLLVDDDDLLLARLSEVLGLAGFEVCTATSGSEALDSLNQGFAPIVITDLNMPEMSGLLVCRTIRARTWPGYVYVLLLTNQDSEEDILAGFDAGADDYINKQTSPAQLLARMRCAQRILTLELSLKSALAGKRRLALTDVLTGAPNRRYFDQRLRRELERVRKFGGKLCVMSLDVDHFKQVNDRYGHAAGDTVLVEFVRRLRLCLPRTTDWLARMGGEEFAVVLEETDIRGARIVAERLRQAVAKSPIRTRAGNVTVTVSIGVADLDTAMNRSEGTLESLLRQADRYLYISKENGRNCATFPPMEAGQ
jgi:two-component system cell cycle response regulator